MRSPSVLCSLSTASLLLFGCVTLKKVPVPPPSAPVVATLELLPGVSLTAQVASLEALTQSAQAQPSNALEACSTYWALALNQEGAGQTDAAVKSLERGAEWGKWGLRSLSNSAQLNAVYGDLQLRLAWIGGAMTAMPHAMMGAMALDHAKHLDAADPVVAGARARSKIYLSEVLGGDPAKAAELFSAWADGKDPGGWNAYWAAEACRQWHKKAQARQWYERALGVNPAFGLAKQGLEKVK